MIGTIIGDIIGSPYEGSHLTSVDDRDFHPLFIDGVSRFTDDTVLTVATADAILKHINYGGGKYPFFSQEYKTWARKYPNAGYGKAFKEWFKSDEMCVNNSYANGSIMRCSPIPMFYKNAHLDFVHAWAAESIKMTHNSPESDRGIKSITTAIHMALNGKSKLEIKAFVEEQYGHMCDASVLEVRNWWPKNTIRCNVYAPQSLIAFLQSNDYETAIRNAVFMKGDTDTTAAIAGAIAEAFYGTNSIPEFMVEEARKLLPDEMKDVVNRFYARLSLIGKDKKYGGFQL
jgi:ADP-ribosylglycohydrolase